MDASINSNHRNAQTISTDIVQRTIEQARSAYVLSKDSAMNAAAYVYIVWRDTESTSASGDMKRWLNDKIKQFNAEVETHNKAEKNLRGRVEGLRDDKLAADDPLVILATTPQEIADQNKDRINLLELASLNKDQWDARRKVRIFEERDDCDFTGIVRYCLGIDLRGEATLVSRYAKVLQWINDNFGTTVVNDPEEIVKAMKDFGGFEAIVRAQRKPDAEDSLADRKIIVDALIAAVSEAIRNAPPKHDFDMEVANSATGFVSLLARYNGGKVEVVGALPLQQSELDQTFSKFSDATLPPASRSTEFVSRVLALGELVSDGEKTKISVDGTKSGKQHNAERVLSLVPTLKSVTQFVVSAKYAEASAIVKAIPNWDAFDLGDMNSPLELSHADCQQLRRDLSESLRRRLFSISLFIEGDDVSLLVENSALKAKGRSTANRLLGFVKTAEQVHRPLDVDNYRPKFKLNISANDLSTLYRERLFGWDKLKEVQTTKKQMTLEFANGTMTYKAEGQDNLAFRCEGQNSALTSLNFRPRDLIHLFKVLTEQGAKSFAIEGDDAGLLCVKWSDQLGRYEVYLPTATKDSYLQSKRLAPMNCDVDFQRVA